MDISSKLDVAKGLFSSPPNVSTINQVLSEAASMPSAAQLRLRIWQNHNAAIFSRALRAIGLLQNIDIQVEDEGYDDSFSWFGLDPSALQLVWVDVDRLDNGGEEAKEWFTNRIISLVEQVNFLPIVVLSSQRRQVLSSWKKAISNVVGEENVFSAWEYFLESLEEERVIDLRMKRVGGTYISMPRQAEIATQVVSSIFQFATWAPKKLIVVDFDWTMYSGVLLEDGPSGVVLENHHLHLWDLLKRAFDAGVLLAIASKNEYELVAQFFELNKNILPLSIQQFIGVEAHFGAKSESIHKLIARAKTSGKDTIFVDDNVGELAEVSSSIPELNLVVGGMGFSTNSWLSSFPGIPWNKIDENALTRVADILAAIDRENFSLDSLADSNPNSMLNQMGIELAFRVNESIDLARIADMVARTNQFNSNLSRKSEEEISELCSLDSTSFVTVSLRDRFVDSGVIFAAIISKEHGSCSIIENLVLSCRAMGRGLEPLIISKSLLLLLEDTKIKELDLPWVIGPRNQPFIQFLNDISDSEVLVEHTESELGNSGVFRLTESLLNKVSIDDFQIKITIEKGSK